jgi:long-chain acyl-CoA synthetase
MENKNTLVHRIAKWATELPDRPAIHGRDKSGNWNNRTWSQYWQDTRKIAKGLITLGHEAGDCVGLVGVNRPEWVTSQFGIMAASGIPAPIYTTNTNDQVAFILAHCRCKIAICDDRSQLDKYLAACDTDNVLVEKIVTMDSVDCDDDRVISLETLIQLGNKEDDSKLDKRLDELDPAATGLLIYTSGTTGMPKAVQLTHEGMTKMGDVLVALEPELDPDTYRLVSYLPLCHVAEQLFTNFMHISTGGQVYFCGDIKEIKEYLTHVRPTVFLGVPRVWEKFEGVLKAKFSEATGIKAKLLSWATKTEFAAFTKAVAARREPQSFGRKMANKLVISKVKAQLGLDELRMAATGAAPISLRTLEFFASLGIRVTEGYGMSETTGVATVSDTKFPVFGHVGKALDGVQVRIAQDGEIQLKGMTMTKGYLHQPEETAELIAEDGWLCTGDLGAITDDGLLKITGRKKDLLITAGGKNVAPAEIEALLSRIPGVGQAVVVGDRQPYLSALLVLDSETLPAFCSELGIAKADIADVAKNATVREHFQKHIEADCNAKLARYQTVKKFEVLPVEFTVDGGELTPTMKIKRNIVNEKYKATIDQLFA